MAGSYSAPSTTRASPWNFSRSSAAHAGHGPAKRIIVSAPQRRQDIGTGGKASSSRRMQPRGTTGILARGRSEVGDAGADRGAQAGKDPRHQEQRPSILGLVATTGLAVLVVRS